MDMNLGYIISTQISLTAQHDSSRLEFPALITALCKARGVISNSLTLESLGPTINVAYVKKIVGTLMTSQLPSEGRARTRGRGLRLPHLLRFPLPQLLYMHDPQIFHLHLRCFISCSRAYTGGSPSSCRACRAWACHPL